MPDFADRLVEKLDKLVEVGGHGAWGGLDIEAAAKLIRECCVEKPKPLTFDKNDWLPKCICACGNTMRGEEVCPTCGVTGHGRPLPFAGPTQVLEGGEATVNKDTGTVSIAAGKGMINGEPVSWEASEDLVVELRKSPEFEKAVEALYAAERKPRERKHVQFYSPYEDPEDDS